MCLRQGTCRTPLLMHDLTIPNASGFCVKIHSRPLEMGCCQNSPLKFMYRQAYIYLLFSLLFSSAKSVWPSAIPIIEAIVPIKKKLSVCKSTRLKINLSLMP